jgi:hypothetical protein
MTERNYHGVYFKWGSLIGISPVGNFGSSTYIYKYTNGEWQRTTELSGDWSAIKAYAYNNDQLVWSPKENFFIHNLIPDDTNNHTGDICRFLGGKNGNPTGYRLPTSNELNYAGKTGHEWDVNDVVGNDEWSKVDGASGAPWKSGTVTANAAGTASIDWGGKMFGITFPASGYIDGVYGYRTSFGRGGDYWSGSAFGGATSSYAIFFSETSVSPGSSLDRSNALTVRCVTE